MPAGGGMHARGGGAQWASKAELEAARLALEAQLEGVMAQLKQASCLPRSLVITPVAARRGHGASQAGRAASYYMPLPHATRLYLMLHHAPTPCYTPLLPATRSCPPHCRPGCWVASHC